MFCFNHLGDLERALLRNGNVASADDWRSVLEPVVARYRDVDIRKYFRVTNLPWRCKRVVRFHNQRGTAEQWIKEGKNAGKWSKLLCHDFADNQVRLQLFTLACNLGNFLRRLVLPKPMRHWTMTSLREKLIKIGAKVVRHSKYVFFQMAEVAVSRKLFAAILDRIQRLRFVPAMAPSCWLNTLLKTVPVAMVPGDALRRSQETSPKSRPWHAPRRSFHRSGP